MLEDCISIDELKMFLGTGLKMKTPHAEICFFDGLKISKRNCVLFDMGVACEIMNIQPYVKSLSKMKDDEKLYIETKFGWRFGSYVNDNQLCFNSWTCGDSMFVILKYLIEHGYDVFNWLGRRLAIELKED